MSSQATSNGHVSWNGTDFVVHRRWSNLVHGASLRSPHRFRLRSSNAIDSAVLTGGVRGLGKILVVVEPPSAVSRVGHPTHERRLTDGFSRFAVHLVPPGAGRSLYLVHEPELRRGRPDLIALIVSASGLSAYTGRAQRVANPAHAHALAECGGQSSRANSIGSNDPAKKEMWHALRQVKQAGRILDDSIGIEAKVKDWRQAMRQVARFRPAVHRAALLLPAKVAEKVPGLSLDLYRCGIMSEVDQGIVWSVPAHRSEIGVAEKIWLLELLMRGLDDGSAYSASIRRKSASAPEKE